MDPRAKPEVPRSRRWPACRRAHLKRQPVCQACGSRKNLEVHHRLPFHLFPELELVQENLITLCEDPGKNCHFMFGHLYSWHAYNPSVVEDAALWREKIATRAVA